MSLRTWMLLGALALLSAGCSSVSTYLNEREAQGCVRISGAYGLFASAEAIYATGGASLEQCRMLR